MACSESVVSELDSVCGLSVVAGQPRPSTCLSALHRAFTNTIPGWCVLTAMLLPGCGKSTNSKSNSQATPPAKSSYAIGDLPAVEFNLPEVDEGRLRIPTPATWKSGSRRSDMLVWFFYRDRNGLPRLVVRARDAADEFRTVSADNIEAYASATGKRLESEPALLEPVKVMTLGDHSCLRYVLAGKTDKGATVDRQILLITRNGREYEIELQVLSGTIHQFKTAAYAVMANMKFQDAAGASNNKPDDAKSDDAKAPEESSDKTPAQTNPNDKKPDETKTEPEKSAAHIPTRSMITES